MSEYDRIASKMYKKCIQNVEGQHQTLPEYETGVLVGKISFRNKWYQFWKPKFTEKDIGTYTKVGRIISFNIEIGQIFISGHAQNGDMTGHISGLPENKDLAK